MSRNLSDQGDPSCKIFVGDLSTSVTKQDLNDAFSYYGPIRHSWVARNPPGFGFVEFEDPRDAEDAVKDRKKDGGKLICGRRVRVELFNRSKMHSKYHYVNKGRPYRPENRCYECGVRGHYARNCYKHKRGFRRRYRSRTPDRHYRSRGKYSRSHSDSRRSRSMSRRSESIGRRSFSNDRKRSISNSRSRSPLRKKRVSTSRSNSRSD